MRLAILSVLLIAVLLSGCTKTSSQFGQTTETLKEPVQKAVKTTQQESPSTAAFASEEMPPALPTGEVIKVSFGE